MTLKTTKGRLLQDGVLEIHRLRDAYNPDCSPKEPSEEWTLQKIAWQLELSLGTVHKICKGETHPDLHPSKPYYWSLMAARALPQPG